MCMHTCVPHGQIDDGVGGGGGGEKKELVALSSATPVLSPSLRSHQPIGVKMLIFSPWLHNHLVLRETRKDNN